MVLPLKRDKIAPLITKSYRHICVERRTNMTQQEFMDSYPRMADEDRVSMLDKLGIGEENLRGAMALALDGGETQNFSKLVRAYQKDKLLGIRR